jgi:hypothetical protein
MVGAVGFFANEPLLGRPEGCLTSPTGRQYITGIVRRVDSLSSAGIRHVPEEANSYISS